MKYRLSSILRFLPTTMVLVTIFYLSLSSNPVPHSGGFFNFPGADKIVHGLMYMGLTGIFCFDLYRKGIVKKESLCIMAAFTTAVVIGGIIEILQEWMQMGRSGDFYDFLADIAGAAIGMVAGLWIIKPVLSNRRHQMVHPSEE